jgi:hypothetical protein
MNYLIKAKDFLVELFFGKLIRHYKYKKRMKEMKERDPFIY